MPYRGKGFEGFKEAMLKYQHYVDISTPSRCCQGRYKNLT
jgi:hypothetical protein